MRLNKLEIVAKSLSGTRSEHVRGCRNLKESQRDCQEQF